MEADLAALLRRHRAAAQFTQEDLAARSGVSVKAISALERGSRRRPQQKTLGQLATALGLSEPQLDGLVRAASGGGKAAKEPADRPRELPADVSVMVGRDELLIDAEARLTARSDSGAVPAVLCLYGAAGMGKSAVAVRVGHTVAGSYPDGQLFARLQDTDGEAVPARTALGRLLRSLGVPADRVPDREDERSALFRSQLAERAVLLVLDDAVDVAQVRPLMPADSRCGVIVTARRPMLGLEDAEHRELDRLSDKVSRQLLVELAHGSIAERDEAGVAAIVRQCAGLPLALRIVGLQLALTRGRDVDRVAAALADDARRLDSLVAGDLAVRTSLDVALATADEPARALFGRLALIGADEFSAWVAAPLLDCDEDAGAPVIERLADLGMIQLRRTTPHPRYGMHGLLRAYAAERLRQTAIDERSAAEVRYLTTLLKLATIADDALDHGMLPAEDLSHDGGRVLPNVEAAVAARPDEWLAVETAGAAAAVTRAVRAHRPDLAARLALRLNGHLAIRDDRETRLEALDTARRAIAGWTDLEGRLDLAYCGALTQGGGSARELLAVAEHTVASVARLGRPGFEVSALSYLGHAANRLCDFDRALRAHERALELVDANPDLRHLRPFRLAHVGWVLVDMGETRRGVEVLRQARSLSGGPSRPRAIMLVALADGLAEIGAVEEMASVVGEARRIVTELDDPLGDAHVDCRAAWLALLSGDADEADRLLDSAEAAFADHPDVNGTVLLQRVRAEVLRACGRLDEAKAILQATASAIGDEHPLGATLCRRVLASDAFAPVDN